MDLADILDSMPNGNGLKVEYVDNSVAVFPVSRGDLISLLINQTKIPIVAMLNRPGSAFFVRYLEIEHYGPYSGRDDLFDLYYYKLDDIMYYIISIPSADEAILEEVATATRMRLEKDHQIVLISSEGVSEALPFCERAIVLVNEPNHLTYTDTNKAFEQQTNDINLLEARALATGAIKNDPDL